MTETKTDNKTQWTELGLNTKLLDAISKKGFDYPTPVQAKAIPLAIEGTDLLVRSKTGTGKTAAFMIPTIERLSNTKGKTSVVVLCPTRELAIQIGRETEELLDGQELSVCCIYGGAPMNPQIEALEKGVEIIVGTPGRVLDHVRRQNLNLKTIDVGILDEADEMLSMGFLKEVTEFLDGLPKTAQILLFSATIEERLKSLIGRFLKDPQDVYISLDGDRVPENIRHVLYKSSASYPKPRQLLHVITKESPDSAIIFCNTRSDTEMVSGVLSKQGLKAEFLSSDLSQSEREAVMVRMKAGQIAYLVCTDIAARGIDINDLSHVFNYSLPEDPAVYLHRAGRTGRIGKEGTAISFMGGREVNCKRALKEKYDLGFEEHDVPTKEEADEFWFQHQMGHIKDAINNGMPFEGYLNIAKRMRSAGPKADMYIATTLYGFFEWMREKNKDSNDQRQRIREKKQRHQQQRSGHSHRGKKNRRPRRR